MAHVQRATIGFPSRHAAQALVLQKVASNGHWIVFAAVMVVGFCAALLPVRPQRARSDVLRRLGVAPARGQEAGGLGRGPRARAVRHGLVAVASSAPAALSPSTARCSRRGSPARRSVCRASRSPRRFSTRSSRFISPGPAYLAAAGALLYALNPNILYLGVIAMTEGPFMLLFVGAAYFSACGTAAGRPAQPDMFLDPRGAGHVVQVRRLDPAAVLRPGGRCWCWCEPTWPRPGRWQACCWR